LFYKFNLSSFFLILVSINICLFSQQTNRLNKYKYALPLEENKIQTYHNSYYTGPGIQLEDGNADNPNYEIGPEIAITGLTGYYDWQTNGTCPHYLSYISDNIVHAIYMTSFDSLNISNTRRTRYSFSTNGGSNWLYITEVPNYRSGFPTLTYGNTGASFNAAIIGNHYQPSNQLTAGIHVDLVPGAGTFTTTTWSFNTTNFIWPIVATFSNGNVLIGAETYQSAAGTDTGLIQIFNPNTNSWIGNPRLLVSPATDQINMRWVTAAGPNGNGIYVLDPIADAGGTYGGNRIFYWTTADNGQTWNGPMLLWESNFDTSWVFHTAWLGLDAVYDNAGNFYVAFNTFGGDSLSQSRIWITKNGGPAVCVAVNNQIPGAAWEMTQIMANVCTMDWPSLSVSDDGQYIFCAYSVLKQNDIINFFQAFDLFYSFSQTNMLNFTGNGPIQITSGTNDERYVSLGRKAFTQSPNTYILPLVYQKDPQPGSAAFSDNAPISRASLIFRKITQAQIFTKQNNEGQNIPVHYSLFQNYPNPFNPRTKIKFEIPKSSYTKLIVYDIIGREVGTLVNEQLQPGTYEIEWNASECASGVYFCKLTTDDYIQIKKMVFLK